nr:MAG TPA: HNH endonuclease bacteriophage, HNH Endonuclease, DNA.52A [Caudoviricetes sp.]
MKEYAKRFYTSKAWRDTQKAFMESKNYICERCGSEGIRKTFLHVKGVA